MERRFSVTVAGQALLVSVRSAEDGAVFISVGGDAPVRVERRDLGQTTLSQWSWRHEDTVVRATVDKLGADLRVGLRGVEVVAKVQDGQKALVASLGLAPVRGPLGALRLRTQIPGRVVKVLASVGDAVREGQALVVVEAMKMENEIRAPRDGHVAEVSVGEGATVEAGACLLVMAAMP